MITKDEGEIQKTAKEKQTKAERSKGRGSYSKRARAKWLCRAFKLGFLKLLILNELKTSLMLKFSLQNSLQSFKSLILTWCDGLPIYGNLK